MPCLTGRVSWRRQDLQPLLSPALERFAAAGEPHRRIIRLHLPPTLNDALSKAMSYEANRWRFSRLRWRQEDTTGHAETTEEGTDGRAEPTQVSESGGQVSESGGQVSESGGQGLHR